MPMGATQITEMTRSHRSMKSYIVYVFLKSYDLVLDIFTNTQNCKRLKIFTFIICNDSAQFSSVQSLSRIRLFATPWIAAHQASLSNTNSQIYSNSYPSSRWCHPAISSSVVPFSSCPQSLPASGSFPTSQLFSWGSQSIGVSASAILPMNTQDWSFVMIKTC